MDHGTDLKRENKGVRHRGIVQAPYIIRYRDGCLESAGCDYNKAVETAKGKAHLHGGIELIV